MTIGIYRMSGCFCFDISAHFMQYYARTCQTAATNDGK